MQSGSIESGRERLVLARDTAAQGCGSVRVGGYTGLTTDVVKEVRPQKNSYVSAKRELLCAMPCYNAG